MFCSVSLIFRALRGQVEIFPAFALFPAFPRIFERYIDKLRFLQSAHGPVREEHPRQKREKAITPREV